MTKREKPFGSPAHRLTANEAPGKVDDLTRRFKLSDSSVALDGHRLATDGWDLSRAKDNMPVLWAHDAETVEHVLGQWVNIHVEGDGLFGDAEFMPRSINPTAGMVLDMVDAGYLRMCSVGFVPTDGKPSKRGPGTFDFTEQTLLEASIVPVGSLATALIQARDAGIDISPAREWAKRNLEIDMAESAKMFPGKRAAGEDWKCGASLDLPLDESASWDAAAAEASIWEACGFDGDNPDAEKARKAFLAYDASAPGLKGSYKLPLAKIEDGKMTAVLAGVRAAAARLSGTDIPDETKKSAQAAIDHYESKADAAEKTESRAPKISKRGLYTVAELAYALMQLGWITEESEWEAQYEGDDSPVPAMLQDCLKGLGEALIAMTQEEVAELLSEDQGEDSQIDAYALMMSADAETRATLVDALRDAASGKTVSITTTRAVGRIRAGKAISKENLDTLKEVHDHMCRATEHVRCLIKRGEEDMDSPDDASSGESERSARARRERLAKAVQAQLAQIAD